MSLGFLRKEHAPTTESAASFPVDIEEPPKEIYDKTIFQANEDQKRMWGMKGTHVVEHKSKNHDISDFVSEDGFLEITDDDNCCSARQQLEYGEMLKDIGQMRSL